MPNESQHINYNFEDIQRYLQGKMSAGEMHEIERAALQDSFLADAIEGYSKISSETSRKHLNELNTELQKPSSSKVVSIKKKRVETG